MLEDTVSSEASQPGLLTARWHLHRLLPLGVSGTCALLRKTPVLSHLGSEDLILPQLTL